MDKIPGILILNDNKTYGRASNNRLLYRCIPNNPLIPQFLIPYKVNVRFSKVLKNLYILFSKKVLIETIGEIDILENFYEYQLYCRDLKRKHPCFSLCPEITIPDQKRENNQSFIFTIDSPGTIDFDDAFSIESISETDIKITIYIANVPFILSKYNLWNIFPLFQERVSSIYLPHKKIPLFPTKLSELCSLTAGQDRMTFFLSLYIDKKNHQIYRHQFQCEFIHVSKNYTYESADLLVNPNYIQLLDSTRSILKKNIHKSDELVEAWMIFMGEKCAQEIDDGIYLLQRETTRDTTTRDTTTGETTGDTTTRDTTTRDTTTRDTTTRDTTTGDTTTGDTTTRDTTTGDTTTRDTTTRDTTTRDTTTRDTTTRDTTTRETDNTTIKELHHKTFTSFHVLEKPENPYMHITSPIRRIVDIINMAQFMNHLDKTDPSFSPHIDNVKQNLLKINTTTKSIKKVQSQCRLYHMFNHEPKNKLYNGILFDKRETKTPEIYSYSVYLTEYKFTTTIKGDEYKSGEYKFRLYLFKNASTLKQKIRLQIVDPC